MIRRSIAVFVTAIALGLGATAHAALFEANLDGLQEVPPNASPAFGLATITLDGPQNNLTVDLVFQDLLAGNVAAHIHAAANPGVNAIVALNFTGFPIGATSGVYNNTFDLTDIGVYNGAYVTNNGGTAASARAALLAALFGEQAYVNIHSSVFPGGEIRGQILNVVPEPASLAILALAPVMFLRRRH